MWSFHWINSFFSCDGAGANPFYLRARRRESDETSDRESTKKKFSLDTHLPTIYWINWSGKSGNIHPYHSQFNALSYISDQKRVCAQPKTWNETENVETLKMFLRQSFLVSICDFFKRKSTRILFFIFKDIVWNLLNSMKINLTLDLAISWVPFWK